MTSLTERLADEGTRQAMEYEEEFIYNTVVISWNTIVFMAKKVKDIVLHMMTALVIAPQPATSQNPPTNSPHTLCKVPNTLVIK